MNEKIVKILTDKVIEQLEQGRVPWRKPWNADTWPHNAVSHKVYHGFNVIRLGSSGMPHSGWLTFNQAKKIGATIRKGEHATPVVLWKFLEVADKNDPEKIKTVPMLRYFSVFNTSQLDGTGKLDLSIGATNIPTVDSAESIVYGYADHPPIIYDLLGAAHYRPDKDEVHMSPRDTHVSASEFYHTLFHELSHSTGHESRLNRNFEKRVAFGSEDYSKEELIAEMSATMLDSMAGIDPDITNSAAYCRSWLAKLKDDPGMLLSAAGKAQKVVDYITK